LLACNISYTEQEKRQGWAPGGPATLFLFGVLHIGLFANATSDDRAPLSPVLGMWNIAVSIPLLILAVIEMRRGNRYSG
jgi:hypothetical protein